MQLRRELERRQAVPRPLPTPAPPTDSGAAVRLFGRKDVGDRVRAVLDKAVPGEASRCWSWARRGIGKSAVLDLAEALARRQGWKVARGGASSVEGPWPYAPVLEALSALCRRHPALLDGLGDDYRAEIERALAGQDLGWTGENSHQRLFVAAAELMRVAAAGPGLLLVVDDLHDADEASLRLLHYLARCAVDERVVLVLAHREPAPALVHDITASMVARGGGHLVELRPLGAGSIPTPAARQVPRARPGHAWRRSTQTGGGLPFAMIEMARARASGSSTVSAVLPPDALRTFQRVALLGLSFSTDELLAVVDVSEDETYGQLELAVAALVVEPAEGGFRFRHPLVREGLVQQLAPHQRSRDTSGSRRRWPRWTGPRAGSPTTTSPPASRRGRCPTSCRPWRSPEPSAPTATPWPWSTASASTPGPSTGRSCWRAAGTCSWPWATPAPSRRTPRPRGSRPAPCTGWSAPGWRGRPPSAATSRPRARRWPDWSSRTTRPMRRCSSPSGMLAYFTGDMETARRVATEARDRLRGVDDPGTSSTWSGLQGLLAHHRGEWFANFRTELRRTQGHDRLAGALFDAHLCVAENLLYGLEPYPGDHRRGRAAAASAPARAARCGGWPSPPP